MPALISSATNDLRIEMDALQKKLHEAQAKLTDKNQEKEWQSLKTQLAKVELQLKEEQNTCCLLTEEMREEIKRKSCELEKLTREQTQLIENLNQVQEEVRIQP